jgi:hypothetical protein
MEQFGEEVAEQADDMEQEQVAEQADDMELEQFGEQADDMDQSEYDVWEHVAHTWKQWGDDEDVKTGLLDECDNDFNLRGLAPRKATRWQTQMAQRNTRFEKTSRFAVYVKVL